MILTFIRDPFDVAILRIRQLWLRIDDKGIPNSILATNEAEVLKISIENNLHNTHSVLVTEKEAYVFEQAKNSYVF